VSVAAASVEDMRAIRESVALSVMDHVVVLRLTGDGAFGLLDSVSTAPLFLREGEMRHTLFLTEDARLFADVFIASDEDGFFVFAEGPSQADLLAYLNEHGGAHAATTTMNPLGGSHELLGLNGPYAWELAAALLGPTVLGMTYLTLLRLPEDEVICFRAGKTGEYGYDLLVPREQAATFRERLLRLGAPLDLRLVALAALDQAALENWQFNIRALPTAARGALTPIELQLQWRVGAERGFVGAPAFRARRATGPAARATCFTAAGPVAAGELVRHGDTIVGEVLVTGWSHARGDLVGTALIETAHAHPWIDAFVVDTGAGPVPISTRTPPLLDNRSLYVDPHRHSYATRVTDTFPPLVLT
jgi:glycine cleavage system aminomethyltransferase T